MLTSQTRLIAAAFAGGLSLAACGGGNSPSSITPLAQSVQRATQAKGSGADCKTLALVNSKIPGLHAGSGAGATQSGCGIRVSHTPASGTQSGKVQVFDVPGAINENNCTYYEQFNDCGTFALSLNASGTIVGWYVNTKGVVRAFIRSANATYKTFEARRNEPTTPFDITDAGAISGTYADGGVDHAFVRRPDGSFLRYEAPWAGQTSGDSIPQGTQAGAIDARGETGGIYFDAGGVLRGFIRHRNGTFVQVIPNGSSASSVCVVCLNNHGVASGDYTGSDGTPRGFIRSPGGTIRPIVKRGALETFVSGINNSGSVPGYYVDKNGVAWGFILGANMKRIVFQDPQASETYGNGTVPEAINDAGAVTGIYADAQGNIHGFYRSPGGQFTQFDPQGSVYTLPYAINANGTVAGYWYDAQGGTHGLIFTPQ